MAAVGSVGSMLTDAPLVTACPHAPSNSISAISRMTNLHCFIIVFLCVFSMDQTDACDNYLMHT